MKKALCILTALFAISWASAQTSSSQSSGGSSDQSSMSSKQGMQEKGMKKGGKKEATLTGCLSGPNAEGNYELQHGKRKVEVSSSEDLKAHVGHTVKLHGTWAKAAAAETGEAAAGTEKGTKKAGKAARVFQVSSIDHVSDTCEAGAMGKGGKMNHKMKKGDMGGMSPSPSPTPSPK